jgi:hypothetical protein
MQNFIRFLYYIFHEAPKRNGYNASIIPTMKIWYCWRMRMREVLSSQQPTANYQPLNSTRLIELELIQTQMTQKAYGPAILQTILPL